MVLSEINDKKLKIYTNLANVAARYTGGVNDVWSEWQTPKCN